LPLDYGGEMKMSVTNGAMWYNSYVDGQIGTRNRKYPHDQAGPWLWGILFYRG
jgi:hypothetical protein